MKINDVFVMMYYVLETFYNICNKKIIKRKLVEFEPYVFNCSSLFHCVPNEFEDEFLKTYPKGDCSIEEGYKYILDYVKNFYNKTKLINDYMNVEDFKFATQNIINAMDS